MKFVYQNQLTEIICHELHQPEKRPLHHHQCLLPNQGMLSINHRRGSSLQIALCAGRGEGPVSLPSYLRFFAPPDGSVVHQQQRYLAINQEAQGIDFKLRAITSDEFPALERR